MCRPLYRPACMIAIAFCWLFILSIHSAPAAPVPKTIYIDDNAPNDPGPGNPAISDPLANGSAAHPFDAIQKGIDAANSGDTLIVSPGFYRENIKFKGKTIILRSTNPASAATVRATVIDGGTAAAPAVMFQGNEGTTCALDGFKITHGGGKYGAGINGAGTRATIRDNLVTSNTATQNGGGIYQCHGLITANTITTNSVFNKYWLTFGGGGLADCDGRIANNTISGNIVTGSYFPGSPNYEVGGGLAYCDGTIENNIISANIISSPVRYFSNGRGSGLYDCQGAIRNNRIENNECSGRGGALSDCHKVIEFNNITGNFGEWGGGGLSDCNALIRGNNISNNLTAEFGGGLSNCGGDIVDNTITHNVANPANGIGAGLAGCDGRIVNNLIALNTGADGGGMYSCNGLIQNNTVVYNVGIYSSGGIGYSYGQINNCIIWGNTVNGRSSQVWGSVPNYCCIQDWTKLDGGIGNTASAPKFVSVAAENFQLAAGSVGIDAGSNGLLAPDYDDLDGDGDTSETLSLDLDGKPRVSDGNADSLDTVDMGAYEYTLISPARMWIPSSSVAAAKQTVTIQVQLSGVSGLRSVTGLKIRYNPNVVHLPAAARVSAGSLVKGWIVSASVTEVGDSGQVLITAQGSAVSAATQATLFNITFDVTRRPGEMARLSLAEGYMRNSIGVEVPAWRESGFLSITPPARRNAVRRWVFYE